MVGIVIVSHSKNLADSVAEFTGLMAPDAKIAAAGGMEAEDLEPVLRRFRQRSMKSIQKTES